MRSKIRELIEEKRQSNKEESEQLKAEESAPSSTATNSDHRTTTSAGPKGGPKTPEGKQRASMNAFKHGLTGHNFMIQAGEHEAYERTYRTLHAEHDPQTETERQLVNQLVHCFMKINRAHAIENNIFSIATVESGTDAPHDDATETMVAQTRAWLANENSLDKLGRYGSRLLRDLLKIQREIERHQDARKAQAIIASLRPSAESQLLQNTMVHSGPSSFRQNPGRPAPPAPPAPPATETNAAAPAERPVIARPVAENNPRSPIPMPSAVVLSPVTLPETQPRL